MDPKQLLIIGAGTAVVGGGAASAYFLIPEKKEATVESQGSGEVVKNTTSLKEALTGVEFLNTKNDTHKVQWGKLVDKFLSESPLNVTKITADEMKKTEPEQHKDENVGILKKACETLLGKTNFQESEKDIARNWCSTNSPLLAEARPDSASVGT